jgi:arylsulfatase A-like enzyme
MVRPNILFILADDLGFGDVSLHGSRQIPTPHIDALAAGGLNLINYRTMPVCSPTRASILSGRHAIHHGVYLPFARGSANRLGLEYTLLPQYLQNLSYDTFLVGKWHLGQNEAAALPIHRGFDHTYGYWTGAEDHYTHQAPQHDGHYDFADGMKTCFAANGTYGTDLFVRRAVAIIGNRSAHPTAPFFLFLALQNVHWPLQAPASALSKFANSTGGDARRQAVAAMASMLDDAVGEVTGALARHGLTESTLILFLSDNGGPTNGNEDTWASNYPLRGGKNTLWEGGTRAVAVASGFGVGAHLRGTRSHALLHACDWLPTLVHLASGSSTWLSDAGGPDVGWPTVGREELFHHRRAAAAKAWRAGGLVEPAWLPGDGVDLLSVLTSGGAGRSELVLEAHPEPAWVHNQSHSGGRGAGGGYAALPRGYDVLGTQRAASDESVHGDALVTADGWKLIRIGSVHPAEEGGWVPPPGEEPGTTYSTACDLSKRPTAAPPRQCADGAWCLFNVAKDPCEYEDLSASHPAVVADLRRRLAVYQATAVPPVKPVGCEPIVVQGAWRPCDAPDPAGGRGMKARTMPSR